MDVFNKGVMAGLQQARGYLLSQDAIDNAANNHTLSEVNLYKYSQTIRDQIQAEINRMMREADDG